MDMSPARKPPAIGLAPRLLAVIAATGAFLGLSGLTVNESPGADPTLGYVEALDPARFERNGTRYTDPDLSPYRILPTLTPHDVTFHYDFARLAETEARLRGVDRRTALQAIFDRVTAGANSNRERHLAVLRFLHKASFHNLIQPTYPDGCAVYDPLVLLELGEMRCGHVNRIAVDLFRTHGWPARLVQVAFHVLAEVWYNGGWHYFEGDIFGNGEAVTLSDGRIPSFAELGEQTEALDALASYWEPDHSNKMSARRRPYPSWFYFGAEAYAESVVEPGFIEKRATPQQESASRLYGWEFSEVIPDPSRQLRRGAGPKRAPLEPRIAEVRVASDSGHRRVEIAWEPDAGAAGYRTFAGRASRGWNYDGNSLPDDLMHFKSGRTGWRPEMYEARYRLPNSDVACVETSRPQVVLLLPPSGPVYITVMSFDTHGEAVGRRLYPMSEELLIP
jgi:hypothetical protein